MSSNTWEVLKGDLFKHVETSIKLFICCSTDTISWKFRWSYDCLLETEAL